MTDVGVWGRTLSRRRQGDLGAEPPGFGDFYNFSIKITFLGMFRLKFLLKNLFLIFSIYKTVNDLETSRNKNS